MRAERLRSGLLFTALLSCQCRGEPAPSLAPSASFAEPALSARSVAPSAEPSVAPSVAAPSEKGAAPSEGGTVPAATAAPAVSSEADEPPLLGPDGAPLPQTEERPSVTSPAFVRRMQRLANAITSGEFEQARPSFFPLVAYAQVKDVAKPERDYRYRLLSHFERDLREYRKALGPDVERAEFLGVDVPEARAQWMKPGKEGNRLGYYRVLRSRLRFRLPSGKEQSLELTSMISWRGEWYVVHLHGFE